MPSQSSTLPFRNRDKGWVKRLVKLGNKSRRRKNKKNGNAPPFFNITRIRVPNYVAKQRAHHESTSGLYCILIEDNNSNKKRLLKACKCWGKTRKRFQIHAELEAKCAVTVRTRAVEDTSGPTWEQFTFKNKMVTPQPLFRIKNGSKLIIAVYKDLRGEDHPLTEAEVKITHAGRMLLQGFPFQIELIVSASSSRPFRIENCKQLNWRPRTREEAEKLWEPFADVHKLGGYDVPVDITDIMEKQFTNDIVIMFNTLFPQRKAIADLLWNMHREFWDKQGSIKKRGPRGSNMMLVRGFSGLFAGKTLSAAAGQLETVDKNDKVIESLSIGDDLGSQNLSPKGSPAKLLRRGSLTSSPATAGSKYTDVTRREIETQLDTVQKKIVFMRRLFLCVATCGLYCSDVSNSIGGMLWPFPMASMLGHGSRILFHLEGISPTDFLYFLFMGELPPQTGIPSTAGGPQSSVAGSTSGPQGSTVGPLGSTPYAGVTPQSTPQLLSASAQGSPQPPSASPPRVSSVPDGVPPGVSPDSSGGLRSAAEFNLAPLPFLPPSMNEVSTKASSDLRVREEPDGNLPDATLLKSDDRVVTPKSGIAGLKAVEVKGVSRQDQTSNLGRDQTISPMAKRRSDRPAFDRQRADKSVFDRQRSDKSAFDKQRSDKPGVENLRYDNQLSSTSFDKQVLNITVSSQNSSPLSSNAQQHNGIVNTAGNSFALNWHRTSSTADQVKSLGKSASIKKFLSGSTHTGAFDGVKNRFGLFSTGAGESVDNLDSLHQHSSGAAGHHDLTNALDVHDHLSKFDRSQHLLQVQSYAEKRCIAILSKLPVKRRIVATHKVERLSPKCPLHPMFQGNGKMFVAALNAMRKNNNANASLELVKTIPDGFHSMTHYPTGSSNSIMTHEGGEGGSKPVQHIVSLGSTFEGGVASNVKLQKFLLEPKFAHIGNRTLLIERIVKPYQANMAAINEGIKALIDGRKGKHWGLDLPIAGVGNPKNIPGVNHNMGFVGFNGELITLLTGAVYESSSNKLTWEGGSVGARSFRRTITNMLSTGAGRSGSRTIDSDSFTRGGTGAGRRGGNNSGGIRGYFHRKREKTRKKKSKGSESRVLQDGASTFDPTRDGRRNIQLGESVRSLISEESSGESTFSATSDTPSTVYRGSQRSLFGGLSPAQTLPRMTYSGRKRFYAPETSKRFKLKRRDLKVPKKAKDGKVNFGSVVTKLFRKSVVGLGSMPLGSQQETRKKEDLGELVSHKQEEEPGGAAGCAAATASNTMDRALMAAQGAFDSPPSVACNGPPKRGKSGDINELRNEKPAEKSPNDDSPIGKMNKTRFAKKKKKSSKKKSSVKTYPGIQNGHLYIRVDEEVDEVAPETLIDGTHEEEGMGPEDGANGEHYGDGANGARGFAMNAGGANAGMDNTNGQRGQRISSSMEAPDSLLGSSLDDMDGQDDPSLVSDMKKSQEQMAAYKASLNQRSFDQKLSRERDNRWIGKAYSAVKMLIEAKSRTSRDGSEREYVLSPPPSIYILKQFLTEYLEVDINGFGQGMAKTLESFHSELLRGESSLVVKIEAEGEPKTKTLSMLAQETAQPKKPFEKPFAATGDVPASVRSNREAPYSPRSLRGTAEETHTSSAPQAIVAEKKNKPEMRDHETKTVDKKSPEGVSKKISNVSDGEIVEDQVVLDEIDKVSFMESTSSKDDKEKKQDRKGTNDDPKNANLVGTSAAVSDSTDQESNLSSRISDSTTILLSSGLSLGSGRLSLMNSDGDPVIITLIRRVCPVIVLVKNNRRILVRTCEISEDERLVSTAPLLPGTKRRLNEPWKNCVYRMLEDDLHLSRENIAGIQAMDNRNQCAKDFIEHDESLSPGNSRTKNDPENDVKAEAGKSDIVVPAPSKSDVIAPTSSKRPQLDLENGLVKAEAQLEAAPYAKRKSQAEAFVRQTLGQTQEKILKRMVKIQTQQEPKGDISNVNEKEGTATMIGKESKSQKQGEVKTFSNEKRHSFSDKLQGFRKSITAVVGGVHSNSTTAVTGHSNQEKKKKLRNQQKIRYTTEETKISRAVPVLSTQYRYYVCKVVLKEDSDWSFSCENVQQSNSMKSRYSQAMMNPKLLNETVIAGQQIATTFITKRTTPLGVRTFYWEWSFELDRTLNIVTLNKFGLGTLRQNNPNNGLKDQEPSGMLESSAGEKKDETNDNVVPIKSGRDILSKSGRELLNKSNRNLLNKSGRDLVNRSARNLEVDDTIIADKDGPTALSKLRRSVRDVGRSFRNILPDQPVKDHNLIKEQIEKDDKTNSPGAEEQFSPRSYPDREEQFPSRDGGMSPRLMPPETPLPIPRDLGPVGVGAVHANLSNVPSFDADELWAEEVLLGAKTYFTSVSYQTNPQTGKQGSTIKSNAGAHGVGSTAYPPKKVKSTVPGATNPGVAEDLVVWGVMAVGQLANQVEVPVYTDVANLTSAVDDPVYVLPVPPSEDALAIFLQRCAEMEYIPKDRLGENHWIFGCYQNPNLPNSTPDFGGKKSASSNIPISRASTSPTSIRTQQSSPSKRAQFLEEDSLMRSISPIHATSHSNRSGAGGTASMSPGRSRKVTASVKLAVVNEHEPSEGSPTIDGKDDPPATSKKRGGFLAQFSQSYGNIRAFREPEVTNLSPSKSIGVEKTLSTTSDWSQPAFSTQLGGIYGASGRNIRPPSTFDAFSEISGADGLTQDSSSDHYQHCRETLGRLYQELVMRKCHLRLKQSSLQRFVEPCLVCLCCEGKILVRTHEELEDGRVNDRFTLLTTKKMPEETWRDAAKRACADELNVYNVDLTAATYSFSEDERVQSSVLPGLPTCYGLHLTKVTVSKEFVEDMVSGKANRADHYDMLKLNESSWLANDNSKTQNSRKNARRDSFGNKFFSIGVSSTGFSGFESGGKGGDVTKGGDSKTEIGDISKGQSIRGFPKKSKNSRYSFVESLASLTSPSNNSNTTNSKCNSVLVEGNGDFGGTSAASMFSRFGSSRSFSFRGKEVGRNVLSDRTIQNSRHGKSSVDPSSESAPMDLKVALEDVVKQVRNRELSAQKFGSRGPTTISGRKFVICSPPNPSLNGSPRSPRLGEPLASPSTPRSPNSRRSIAEQKDQDNTKFKENADSTKSKRDLAKDSGYDSTQTSKESVGSKNNVDILVESSVVIGRRFSLNTGKRLAKEKEKRRRNRENAASTFNQQLMEVMETGTSQALIKTAGVVSSSGLSSQIPTASLQSLNQKDGEKDGDSYPQLTPTSDMVGDPMPTDSYNGGNHGYDHTGYIASPNLSNLTSPISSNTLSPHGGTSSTPVSSPPDSAVGHDSDEDCKLHETPNRLDFIKNLLRGARRRSSLMSRKSTRRYSTLSQKSLASNAEDAIVPKSQKRSSFFGNWRRSFQASSIGAAAAKNADARDDSRNKIDAQDEPEVLFDENKDVSNDPNAAVVKASRSTSSRTSFHLFTGKGLRRATRAGTGDGRVGGSREIHLDDVYPPEDGSNRNNVVQKMSSIQSDNMDVRNFVGIEAALPTGSAHIPRAPALNARRRTTFVKGLAAKIARVASENTNENDRNKSTESPRSVDSFPEQNRFETRPFDCAFWTKVQTAFGTRTRYWNWHPLTELDNLDTAAKMFSDSPLLFSSLVQLREVNADEKEATSLLIGLEGAAPGKTGVAGKHDAGGKSKPYGCWNGLKWRYFGECIPPVPHSVGGMKVNITKPLFELCEKVCAKVLTNPNYVQLIDEILDDVPNLPHDTIGQPTDPDIKRKESLEENLFKKLLKSDGRRAKERIHEFILKHSK